MFELRARYVRGKELALRCQHLGFRGGDVASRHGETCVELILHDIKGLFVQSDGVYEQVDQRVRCAQIEIGGGKLRLCRQLCIFQIGFAGLGRSGIALNLPA